MFIPTRKSLLMRVLSICLEPKLWHLILELIPCFPVPNLARLLRAHGFVNILVKTLKTAVHALSNQGYGLPPSSNGASSESSSAADSSSATVEATVSLPKMSKKRKRDGRMVHQHRAITAYKGDVEPLYDAICATLAELQALTENDDYGYACEHLKMALRATPDKAAEILGSSLIITNHLLRKAAEVRDPIDVGAHRLSLSYWLEVWTTWYSRNAQTGAEVRPMHQEYFWVHALTKFSSLFLPTASFRRLSSLRPSTTW